MEPFETQIDKPDPEKPGYLKFERMATLGELCDYCERALKSSSVLDELEYFGLLHYTDANKPLPRRIKWLAVFAVTGGSEGHYVHIDAITTNDDPHRDHDRETLILGKDLNGDFDTALKVVNVLTPLLS